MAKKTKQKKDWLSCATTPEGILIRYPETRILTREFRVTYPDDAKELDKETNG